MALAAFHSESWGTYTSGSSCFDNECKVVMTVFPFFQKNPVEYLAPERTLTIDFAISSLIVGKEYEAFARVKVMAIASIFFIYTTMF
jgi:hypothetical protein